MASLKEHSKTNWSRHNAADPKDEKYPGDESIKLGCLQRIADATEMMAKNHTTLQEDKERYERWYNASAKRCLKLERSAAYLRGVITKMKKKDRGWIPASNPPELNGEYLVTEDIEDGQPPMSWYAEYHVKGNKWTDPVTGATVKVLAYMDFPTPFKP